MSAHSTNISLRSDHHVGFFHRVMDMIALHKQRRDLARLDDRALRDIGVTRNEAEAESTRPAWDVPHFWMS